MYKEPIFKKLTYKVECFTPQVVFNGMEFGDSEDISRPLSIFESALMHQKDSAPLTFKSLNSGNKGLSVNMYPFHSSLDFLD